MEESDHHHNTNDLYKECLRNHAASLGSYATDGCGEFTLEVDTAGVPSTFHCTACGCHRNFHRKVTYSRSRRHSRSNIQPENTVVMDVMEYSDGGGKTLTTKRYRTKFSGEQKEKMLEFAEKLGWKLGRKDEEDEVERFCRGIGVSRQVFKVWMHNHKNSSSTTASTGNASSLTTQ